MVYKAYYVIDEFEESEFVGREGASVHHNLAGAKKEYTRRHNQGEGVSLIELKLIE